MGLDSWCASIATKSAIILIALNLAIGLLLLLSEHVAYM
jgi:hypothetical protein